MVQSNFVSTCGNNKKYAFDASAYTKATDTGLSEGNVYPDDEGSYATMQYHTPELPFGTTASVAHGNQKSDGQSGNAQATSGDSATFYSVVTADRWFNTFSFTMKRITMVTELMMQVTKTKKVVLTVLNSRMEM